jgi:hypothetical protein
MILLQTFFEVSDRRHAVKVTGRNEIAGKDVLLAGEIRKADKTLVFPWAAHTQTGRNERR